MEKFANSEYFSKWALNMILQRVDSFIIDKVLGQQAQKEVAHQFITKEQQSALQLIPTQVISSILKEDLELKSKTIEVSRPLSGKIQKKIIQAQSNQSIKSIYLRASKRAIVTKCISRSHSTIYSKKRLQCQTVESKLIPILNRNISDELDDPKIDSMRRNKIEEQIEKKKQKKFQQSIKEDILSHSKAQKKFISMNGSKNITYNYRGQIIELSSKKTDQIKRINSSRIVFQNLQQTKAKDTMIQNIEVSYSAIDNKKSELKKTSILKGYQTIENLLQTNKNTAYKIIK